MSATIIHFPCTKRVGEVRRCETNIDLQALAVELAPQEGEQRLKDGRLWVMAGGAWSLFHAPTLVK